MGGSGMIFILSDDVVVKIIRRRYQDEARRAHENEQASFALLEEYGPPCPYLIPCLYRIPPATFTMRAPGTLQGVIASGKYGPEDTHRWMGQLCGGAAYLARAGLAHGDLRPDNLLIDRNRNLRITNLGSALPVGSRLPVGNEPFARLLSQEDGDGAGSYGWAGPGTETFAIGSIFYGLTRGFYPYAREGFDVPTLMKKFKAREFPELGISSDDEIIRKCWHGRYSSVAELELEFRCMKGGGEWYRFEVEAVERLEQLKADCESWASAGGVEGLPIPP